MGTNKKTAILLGATGLTGSLLLKKLLEDNRYEVIKAFSRASVGFVHPKLKEYLIDVLELENHAENFTGDEVFCCIGTTKARTNNKKRYKKIDYGIPKNASLLCKKNGIPTFIVISALGAKSKSRIFYNRIKGEMEDAVIKSNLSKVHILRPSLISGKRKEWRPAEWLAKQTMRALNIVMAGPLERYRPIPPERIVKSMVWLANNEYKNVLIESDEIIKIASKV